MAAKTSAVADWAASRDPYKMIQQVPHRTGRGPNAYRLAAAGILRLVPDAIHAPPLFFNHIADRLEMAAVFGPDEWRTLETWYRGSGVTFFPRELLHFFTSGSGQGSVLWFVRVRGQDSLGSLVLQLQHMIDDFWGNTAGGTFSFDKNYEFDVGAAAVLREVFGSPVKRRPGRVDRPYRWPPREVPVGWRTDTVLALAGRIWELRDFAAMPILADALQDAGCDRADILDHCRDPNAAHSRGCWVLDAVLSP